MPNNEIMTVKELADYLKIAHKTVGKKMPYLLDIHN